MNTRLKQFIAAENLTQAQFADKLNVVRASVSHVLSGRNNPSYDFIKALMQKFPSLNIEWLIFGKGKMYRNQEEEPMESMTLFNEEEEVIGAETGETPPPIMENKTESPVNQRKAAKIIILYDDGSFQEMSRDFFVSLPD